jgi:hypothetical protein
MKGTQMKLMHSYSLNLTIDCFLDLMTRLSKYGTLSLRNASLLYRDMVDLYGVNVYPPKTQTVFWI